MKAAPGAALAGWVATVASVASLGSLIGSGAWVGPSLLAAASGVLAAALARRVTRRRWLVVPAGLVGLALGLTGLFTAPHAWGGFIPSPASADAMRALLTAGVADVAELTAPVPATGGIVALTATGVGVLALTVDAVAVTWGAPAAAGLALLAGYLVPATVHPGWVSLPAFLLAGAGYLLVLVVGARAGTDTSSPRVAGVGPSAVVLAVTSLALAAATPALVPPLPEGSLPFGWGTGGGPGRAATTVSVDNPILNLQADLVRSTDTTVLTYVTDDPTPSYLRVVGLDEFDGLTWAPRRLQVPDSQRVDTGLPRPPGLTDDVPVRTVHTRVRVGADVEQRWLPLPYVAAQVRAAGRWLYDVDSGNVFSPEQVTGGISYQVVSLDRSPTPAQLRGADRPPDRLAGALALPASLRAKVRPTALAVVGDAPTAYDRAVRLQNWLRDPAVFRYDEHAPSGNGSSAVTDFLARRSGYCVHFASTMAVTARSLGIPARVAVGFTPGEPAGQHRWRVGTHDAHAWPELYFEGVGWVPFEPTPAARTGAPPGYTQDTGESGAPGVSDARPQQAGTPLAKQIPDPGLRGGGATAAPQAGTTARSGAGVPRGVWVVLAVLAVAGVALTPAAVRVRRRRRRLGAVDVRRGGGPVDVRRGGGPVDVRRGGAVHPSPAGAAARAAWAELSDTAVDLGYTWTTQRTPRQNAAALRTTARLDETAARALARLTAAVERARYAAEAGPAGDVVGDYLTVRRALVGARSRRTRLEAVLWPRSVRWIRRRAPSGPAQRADGVVSHAS